MPDNNTTGTATSRAGALRPATRKATKARLAMSGPSGSGKTWTSLCIAEILAPGGRYVLIDTEPSDDNNTAAELYADRFTFELIDWTDPPYDPRDLTLTIQDLGSEGIDVLIVDSASAFWRGQGGTLDVVDGAFGGWRTGTPAQNAMIEAILKAPMHVIFCTRAKQAYEVEQGRDGKQTVRKLGLAPIQRDDVEYEFQVVAMIDIDHRIDIGKTRCADLAGMSFHANQQAELGKVYKAWLDKGLTLITQTDADLIRDAMRLIVDKDERVSAARLFKEAHGSPDVLEVDQLSAAWATVSAYTGIDPHPFAPADYDAHLCGSCGLGRRAAWHDGTAPPMPERERPEDDVTPPTLTQAEPEPVSGVDEAREPVEDGTGAHSGPDELPDPADIADDDDPDDERPFSEDAMAERRAGFERRVNAMTVTKTRAMLESAGLDNTGAPPQVKARLVDHFVRQAMQAAAHAEAS